MFIVLKPVSVGRVLTSADLREIFILAYLMHL